MRINKQQMKEDRKLKKKKKLNGNTACECDDKKKMFERQNMTLLIISSRSLMDPLHNSLTK